MDMDAPEIYRGSDLLDYAHHLGRYAVGLHGQVGLSQRNALEYATGLRVLLNGSLPADMEKGLQLAGFPAAGAGLVVKEIERAMRETLGHIDVVEQRLKTVISIAEMAAQSAAELVRAANTMMDTAQEHRHRRGFNPDA